MTLAKEVRNKTFNALDALMPKTPFDKAVVAEKKPKWWVYALPSASLIAVLAIVLSMNLPRLLANGSSEAVDSPSKTSNSVHQNFASTSFIGLGEKDENLSGASFSLTSLSYKDKMLWAQGDYHCDFDNTGWTSATFAELPGSTDQENLPALLESLGESSLAKIYREGECFPNPDLTNSASNVALLNKTFFSDGSGTFYNKNVFPFSGTATFVFPVDESFDSLLNNPDLKNALVFIKSAINSQSHISGFEEASVEVYFGVRFSEIVRE